MKAILRSWRISYRIRLRPSPQSTILQSGRRNWRLLLHDCLLGSRWRGRFAIIGDFVLSKRPARFPWIQGEMLREWTQSLFIGASANGGGLGAMKAGDDQEGIGLDEEKARLGKHSSRALDRGS